jgi:hypothetical protein
MSKNQNQIEAARRLETYLLSEGIRLPHRKALEAVARVENERNWNLLSARANETESAPMQAVAPEGPKPSLPAFDFLPQHFQVTKLLTLCTQLLAKTATDTPEFEQATQILREFENLSVWGEWTARDLEQAVEGYLYDNGMEDNVDVRDEPVRSAVKYALHNYNNRHSSTESDVTFLDTLVRNELDEHYGN